MLRWQIVLSLFIFVALTANLDNADGLKVMTEYGQYEIGDAININIANPANSISIFNYEIVNDHETFFPEKCVTVDDTTDLESEENRMIVVDTECAGPDHIGIWTVSSRLTGDDGLVDLSSSAEFEIVNKIFLCGLDDCSESKDFLDRNKVPIHFQNSTGWNQEKFKRSALYLFSDNFGKIVVPVTTEGNYNLEIKTTEITLLDVIETHERLYTYISDINRSNPLYLKTFDISSVYFFPENKKKTLHISFPNILNLDKFSNELNKFKQVYGYDEEIDNIILHDFIIEGFGKLKIFTSDGFFIEKILPFSDQDNMHTHIMIPQDRSSASIYSNFNGTFIDDPVPLFYDYVFSPLKQTQNGVESQNILCKESLELILHPSSYPACVKPESVQKLIERGWMQSV